MMKKIFQWRIGCILLLGVVVIASTVLIYQWVTNSAFVAQQLAGMSSPTATLPSGKATGETTATPTPKPCKARQRDFEMGIAFPRWYAGGYGGSDNEWLMGLPEMRQQTAACWVEMPILLYQDSLTSSVIKPGPSTPLVESFSYGIRLAHLQGLHVFVTALLQVNEPQAWAGAIQFSTYEQEQQWFESYLRAFQPYLQAAAQEGVEQFALGTEIEWLQENAPDDLWNNLIDSMHRIFPGTLTYDMNWTALSHSPRGWMHNPHLPMIGISAYLPQIDRPERLSQQQISQLWKTTTLPELDAFAQKLGRPLFISEIGYRATADALYHPWMSASNAPADPAEQAAACSAALENVFSDTHIVGIFFWGWNDTGAFNLVNSQAAEAIRSYYQSWQAP